MTKYSIILPVKNGSNHIRQCITSILAQTLKNFELVILENCSTDDTLSIIASFEDPRVKLVPSESPLTMEANWHRILQVPKNEFITLIGHDDFLEPNYLAIMDDLISRHPKATLYQTHFHYVDEMNRIIGECHPMIERIEAPEAVRLFLSNKIDLMGTGFMMRSIDYDAVGGMPMYPNLLFADMELWIELARINYLATDPRMGFSYRKHLSATTSTSSDAKFLRAFESLVSYLSRLREIAPPLSQVITESGITLLTSYCQGLTHKILRVPKNKRETPNVTEVIDMFRNFAPRLGILDFDPMNNKSIKIGKLIDESWLLHKLFLAFKQIYPKSILKSASKDS